MNVHGIASQKRRAAWLAVSMLLALGLLVGPLWALAADSAGPTESGVSQHHKLEFNYLGAASGLEYSCIGMQTILSELLTQLSTAPGFKVLTAGCITPDRPSKFIYVMLEFDSLLPVSVGNTSTVKTGVPGVWQHVAFSPREPRDLGLGGCELIDEFRLKVMPLFAIRNVQTKLNCIPNQNVGGGGFALSFDVFAPATAPQNGEKPSG